MRGKKKVFVFLAVGLLLAMGLAFGCAKEKPEGAPREELAGTIQIAGSTSVQPLSDELAAAFEAKNPGVKVNVAGGGSGAGIKAVQEGTADIGASSRELKPEEKTGLVETRIATDGIAVIVNPANSVADLSLDEVREIFAGKIKNWQEVGGKNAPITVIVREEGSGTWGAFTELVMKETPFTTQAVVQNSTGAVRTAVAGDPNATGFISLGTVSEEVKPLKIDGVEATPENVKAGTYKISRPFLYLTKGEPQGVVKAYIDFVLSPAGQEIVGKDYVPVTK